jgi:hypothetical protein
MDEKGTMLGRGHNRRAIINMAVVRSEARLLDDGGRENNAVVACVSATGAATTPLFILKGAAVNAEWISRDPQAIGRIACAEKGTMTAALALRWLVEIFDPETRGTANGGARLLLLDQHSTHVTPAFIDYCLQSRIYCYNFPSHTTHLLQPCDVGLFAPLAAAYSCGVDDILRDSHGYQHMRKSWFHDVLSKAWVQTVTPVAIKRAFRAAGLVPFNHRVVLNQLPNKEATTSWPAPEEAEDIPTTEDLRAWRQDEIHATPKTAQRYKRLSLGLMNAHINERHMAGEKAAFERSQERRHRPSNKKKLLGDAAIFWDHETYQQMLDDTAKEAASKAAAKAAAKASKTAELAARKAAKEAAKAERRRLRLLEKDLRAWNTEKEREARVRAKQEGIEMRRRAQEDAAAVQTPQVGKTVAAPTVLPPTASGRARRAPSRLAL